MSIFRSEDTIKLYKEYRRDGYNPKVITCGGHKSSFTSDAREYPDSLASRIAEYLFSAPVSLNCSVPGEQIIVSSRGRDTLAEALGAKEIIKQNGFRRILIVTTDKHYPRALWNGKEYWVRNIKF